ncbi:MAG: RDD family protein [Gaiellaceae bacterium]
MDSTFDTPHVGAVTSARAGFWRRFAAAFIDGIVLSVVSEILKLALGGFGTALGLLITIGYFTYFHGSTGQTPGNAALAIRVIDLQGGGSIGYMRAFIRWIVSLVSFIVLLLGYLWMLWDGEKQTWHDKAAGSVVIPVPR